MRGTLTETDSRSQAVFIHESLSVVSAGVAKPSVMLENQIAFLRWKEIASGNSTCSFAPARPETPAMHSTRAPNVVSQPNTALPGNENRPGRWAIR